MYQCLCFHAHVFLGFPNIALHHQITYAIRLTRHGNLQQSRHHPELKAEAFQSMHVAINRIARRNRQFG